MNEQPQKTPLLPPPDYSFEGRGRNRGIGINQPASIHTMMPLFDLGMIHAAMFWRRDYRTNEPLWINRHTFTLLLDGQMTLEIDGTTNKLTPGDLAYYPPGSTITQWNPGNSWYLFLNFNHRPFWDPHQKRGAYVRTYESASLMYLLMEGVASAHDDPTSISLQLAKRQGRMLVDLLRHEITRFTYTSQRNQVTLKQLVEDIRQDPGVSWTIQSMAKKLFVSPRTLNRIFLAEYGVTPIDLVVRERIGRSHEMILKTDMKMAAIAEAVGYTSLPTFSRLFKKLIGRSPGKIRSNIRNTP